MEVKMFVITHKKASIPLVKGYNTLLVGAAGKDIDCFDYRDDVGDNISPKNNNYCELTGIYWIWKNVTADIVGICHYRRYFTRFGISSNPKRFLQIDEIESLFSKYDVIMPRKLWYFGSIKDIVKHAPNKHDLKELNEAIQMICPDYLEDYQKFINQRSAYLFNMCIMKKMDFDNYCKWLFDIMDYIELNHDMNCEDQYRQRLFGFLSERLIYVWIEHNFNKKMICHKNVVNIEESIWKQKLSIVKNYYKSTWVN